MAQDQLLQRLLLQILSGQVGGMDRSREPDFVPDPASGRGAIMPGRAFDTGATLGAPPMEFDRPPTPPAPPAPPGPFSVQGAHFPSEAPLDPSMIRPQQQAGQAPDIQAILRQLADENKGWLAPGGAPSIGDVEPPRTPSPFSVQGGFFPSEAPLDPNMQLPARPTEPGPPTVGPFPPDLGPTVGPFPPDEGELPAGPEKPGDLSRARASGELEKLYAMQAMAEGLGGMEVVTAGDILHRTAKGVGPGRPRGQALKSYTDFLAKRETGKTGQEYALEQIEAKGKRDVKTALASRQPRVLPAGELSAVDAYHNTRRVGKELLGLVDEMSGSLGPLDNILDNAGAMFGWQQGKTAEFRRMVSDVLVRHIREMTGQQMSALEIKNLKKTMPTLENTAKMFKSKLEGVLRHIEDRQEQWAETRREAGYYIPEGLGPVGGAGGTVKHKRTGKTLDVDGETLEKVRRGSTDWEVDTSAGGTGIF